MKIIEIKNHEGFTVFRVEASYPDWYYTNEPVEEGDWVFDYHLSKTGKKWAVGIKRPIPTDYKKLSREFRQRVKEFKK